MVQGIDHIIILVDELDAASAQYQALGFTVFPGGRHPRGTHNALVPFQDGTYLELIAFWDPNDTTHPWHQRLAGPRGLIDFALRSDALDADVAALAQRGLHYTAPQEGSRERPDGVMVVWKGAMPVDTEAKLPFLIEDVTDRERRVPSEAATHANGVTGVERIVVAVDDLAAATRRYALLLGSDPIVENDGGTGTPTAPVTFQSGPHLIELRPDEGAGQAATEATGPVALVLSGATGQEFRPLDTGGARLRIVAAGSA